MAFEQSEHTSELKEILKKRGSLENIVKRYASLFSSKVIEYSEKFGSSEEETSYILYTSDYILTSTEIKGLQDGERIDALFESILYGRDNCHIEVKSQLTLIEMCQQLILALQRHFRYQKNRGFPLSVIKSQLISTLIRDFFHMLNKIHQDVDIRWIIAELEGSYFKEYAKKRHTRIIKDFHLDKFNEDNYYLAGEYFVSQLNLQFEEADELAISKTAFETQTHLSSAFLVVSMEDDIFMGSTLETEFEYNKISSLIQKISSSIPERRTENGDTTLRYYQSFMKKIPSGTGHRIFVVIEQNENFEFLYFLITSNLEDINYTSIRKMLQQYLIDANCLKIIKMDQKINILNQWAERILISQTVEGAEVFDLPHDLDREREWIFESLLHARRLNGTENCVILAREQYHEVVKINMEKLVHLNGLLHEFIDIIFDGINYKYEIIAYEAYHEGVDVENGFLSTYHYERDKFAQINLQTLFKTSERYVHRKNHLVKRKYSRLKGRELALNSGAELKTWATSALDFMDYGDDYIIQDMTVNLLEKLSKKEIEVEIVQTTINVSNKLKEIETKKNLQLDIQEIIYQFMTKVLTCYVKIAILEDPKLKEFVNKEFKSKIIQDERNKIQETIDAYSIRRLPDNLGDKLLEIINTVDNSFTRSLRDGTYKLQDFESKLTNTDLQGLEEFFKSISENI